MISHSKFDSTAAILSLSALSFSLPGSGCSQLPQPPPINAPQVRTSNGFADAAQQLLLTKEIPIERYSIYSDSDGVRALKLEFSCQAPESRELAIKSRMPLGNSWHLSGDAYCQDPTAQPKLFFELRETGYMLLETKRPAAIHSFVVYIIADTKEADAQLGGIEAEMKNSKSAKPVQIFVSSRKRGVDTDEAEKRLKSSSD